MHDGYPFHLRSREDAPSLFRFFEPPPPFIVHHDRIRRVAHARSFRVSSY